MWRNGRHNGLKNQKRGISVRCMPYRESMPYASRNPAFEREFKNSRRVSRQLLNVEQIVEQSFFGKNLAPSYAAIRVVLGGDGLGQPPPDKKQSIHQLRSVFRRKRISNPFGLMRSLQ